MTTGIDKAVPLVRTMLRDFEKRWGVEPTGILMHPITLEHLKDETRKYDVEAPTFQGIKIYTSKEVNVMEIRFVI